MGKHNAQDDQNGGQYPEPHPIAEINWGALIMVKTQLQREGAVKDGKVDLAAFERAMGLAPSRKTRS